MCLCPHQVGLFPAGAALDAPEPLVWLTSVALTARGLGVAHDQWLGGTHRRRHLPGLRTLERAIGLPGLDHVPMHAVRPGGQAFPPIILVTTNTIEKPISLS